MSLRTLNDHSTRSQVAPITEEAWRLTRDRLTAITRQYESTVYTYLFRRLRRSVDANELAQEVFFRFYAAGGLELTREAVRPKLLELARVVLDAFVAGDHPAEQIAWTELCLELDDLVLSRQARNLPR